MADAVPSYCGQVRDRFGRVTYRTPRVYATREQAAWQCFNWRVRAKQCFTTRAALALDGRVVDTRQDEHMHFRRKRHGLPQQPANCRL